MFRFCGRAALFVFLLAPRFLFGSVECGAFSHGGDFAWAQVENATVQLHFNRLGTGENTYTLHATAAKICKLSFSEDDRFLSVSMVKPKFFTDGIAVAIFKIDSGTWVGNKIFQPEYSQFEGGFLGSTHEMATAFLSGEWERGSSLRFQVFTIDADTGRNGEEVLRPLDAPVTSMFPNAFDPAHNRIWNRVPGSACALRYVSILGEKRSGKVSGDLVPNCTNPSVIDFPTSNLVIIGSQDQDSIRLWRIALDGEHSEHLELASDASRALELLDLSAHSPDGKLVAIAMKALPKDRFGGLHDGRYCVALVDVTAWKVFGIYDVKVSKIEQLAVDFRDGKAAIEVNDGQRWVASSVAP